MLAIYIYRKMKCCGVHCSRTQVIAKLSVCLFCGILQKWPPQNKGGRDEYWNGGFILREAKRRKNSGALAHDTALMSLLEKIDNMDSNGSNLAGDLTDVGINGVVNSLEDEIQLKVQTDHNIEKGSSAEMASIKQLGQGQITADQGTTEATMVTPDIWDFTYYDDVGAELGFLIDANLES